MDPLQLTWPDAPNPELDQIIALGALFDTVYKAFDDALYDSEEQALNHVEELRTSYRGKYESQY